MRHRNSDVWHNVQGRQVNVLYCMYKCVVDIVNCIVQPSNESAVQSDEIVM